jgi:signal transduction histidine kinase
LTQYLEYIRADIGNPPDIDKAKNVSQRLPVDIQISGPGVQWASNGSVVDLDTIRLRREFTAEGAHYRTGIWQDRHYLLATYPEYTLAFSMALPREHFHELLPFAFLLLLVLLIGFYFVIKRMFAPIETLRSGIERIGKGELEHRIVVKRDDELGTLADSINGMAGEIKQMLDAKRQLLLAISHELRSPVTRAKVSAELIDDEQQRHHINDDLRRIEYLIEELLETEKLSARHTALNVSDIALVRLATQLIEEKFPGKDITVDAPNEVSVRADATRIKLLLRNLIENALQHTPTGKPAPRISITADSDNVKLIIQDFGVGIAAEHLPYLSEPFYRADPARQRETGGFGIGLYLCRMIAQAHGGSLSVESEVGVGTTVIVRLPMLRHL